MKSHSSFFILILAAALFVSAPSIVRADLLVLKNGDRITGKISRIWDNEVTIEPDYSDKFQVDLPVVAYIESDREFEIDLQDGTSVVARFAGSSASGSQIITTPIESLEVSLDQFFELEEVEDYFDWESHVDLSSNLNKGNTDSNTLKLRADGMLKVGDRRHIGEVTVFREELSGQLTQDQERLNYAYNWLFNDPWYFTSNLSFERDPIFELDRRIILSAGIGHDIWNTPRKGLSTQLGFGFQAEEIGLESKDSTVLVWNLRFRRDFLGDDLNFFHNHTITANVSGRTNTSYRTSTGVSFEITDLLYTNITLDYDYETQPVETVSKEDIALMFGLGLEFD